MAGLKNPIFLPGCGLKSTGEKIWIFTGGVVGSKDCDGNAKLNDISKSVRLKMFVEQWFRCVWL